MSIDNAIEFGQTWRHPKGDFIVVGFTPSGMVRIKRNDDVERIRTPAGLLRDCVLVVPLANPNNQNTEGNPANAHP